MISLLVLVNSFVLICIYTHILHAMILNFVERDKMPYLFRFFPIYCNYSYIRVLKQYIFSVFPTINPQLLSRCNLKRVAKYMPFACLHIISLEGHILLI